MAMSGVQIPADIIQLFTDLKIRKKFRYMVIKLDEAGTGLSAKTGKRESGFADFKKEFSAKECSFGVFDSPDSNKLTFIHWNPDSAPVKSKMSSASAAKGEVYRLSLYTFTVSQLFKTHWKVWGT